MPTMTLESIDSWILQQPSFVDKIRRTLLPVVVQRQTIADCLARNLKDRGLDRKAREININTALAEIRKEEESHRQANSNQQAYP